MIKFDSLSVFIKALITILQVVLDVLNRNEVSNV